MVEPEYAPKAPLAPPKITHRSSEISLKTGHLNWRVSVIDNSEICLYTVVDEGNTTCMYKVMSIYRANKEWPASLEGGAFDDYCRSLVKRCAGITEAK